VVEARFERAGALAGDLDVPGDKSISHRAAIIGALARGTTTITNFSPGADCASTLGVLERLGAAIERETGRLKIEGKGGFFSQPAGDLDCGNSGTTMRLIAGAVAPSPIDVTLAGDESLNGRPMGRVIVPLTLMGARVIASDEGGHPPLRVRGGALEGIEYSPPVASAQVKSAVLLAGLGAAGPTTVYELTATRDHTERMLAKSGVSLRAEGLSVTVEPGVPQAFEMDVPGDFSSAAFFIAAALMCPGSHLRLHGVGLNPTRTAFLDLVRRMGAIVEVSSDRGWEPAGDITAYHSDLSAIEISQADVAGAIDEVTLLALLATAAQGRTVIAGAGELRHKESDRIAATVRGLRALGARIEETHDGMAIDGPTRLKGAAVSSFRDHRLGMMLAVAGLAAEGETTVDGWEWTRISYPGFEEALAGLNERRG
jgi:3-phosphoshikimate 1-carboxyvinyltransferase